MRRRALYAAQVPTPATLTRWTLLAALLPACGADPVDPPASDTGADSSSTASTSSSSSSTTTGDIPTSTTDDSSTEPTTSTGTTATTGDSSTGAEADILELLQAVDGLTVSEQPSKIEGYRFFHLLFQQPVDHDAPDGQWFTQQMTLLHRDRGAPLVLSTRGYHIYPNSQGLEEPSALLHANQLQVEHRFFSVSRPDPADWSKLTIAQAAADHHRVVEALRPIYDAAWISTGTSKGGMTAVYHRRFYPDDVDGTVAYVAPISHGTSDPRYIDFVRDVGDPACRDDLVTAQRELLLRRPAMLTRMQEEATLEGYTYDILGPELALEVVILELPFAFWQYSGLAQCAEIPDIVASDVELWDFLGEHNPPRGQSDEWLLAYEPYYWQAAVQLGAPAIDEEPVADLLLFPGADVPATFIVPGPGKQSMFDPAAMLDVADWVAADGERLLFIYGEHDPWSAGAFELGAAEDAHKLFVPAGNHGADIAGLAEPDRALAHARLEAWTGVQPSARALPRAPSLRTLRDLLP